MITEPSPNLNTFINSDNSVEKRFSLIVPMKLQNLKILRFRNGPLARDLFTTSTST